MRRDSDQEGLEVKGLLLNIYESQRTRTTAMKNVSLLSIDFSKERLLNCLKDFDMDVSEFERDAGERISVNVEFHIVFERYIER